MSEPLEPRIISAKSLRVGETIKFRDQTTSIRAIQKSDSWIVLIFTEPIWDSFAEANTDRFGCDPGFCIRVL